jgi:hypothetical protein
MTAQHVSSDIIAHHQELLNCNYNFWFYSRFSLPAAVTAEWEQPWQRPTTTNVSKTRSCNYSLEAPDDERLYRSKHVEQSRNNGIINCSTQLHLVGHLCKGYIICYSQTSCEKRKKFKRNWRPFATIQYWILYLPVLYIETYKCKLRKLQLNMGVKHGLSL